MCLPASTWVMVLCATSDYWASSVLVEIQGTVTRATPNNRSCRRERNRLEGSNNLLKTIQQETNKMGPVEVQRPGNREAD